MDLNKFFDKNYIVSDWFELKKTKKSKLGAFASKFSVGDLVCFVRDSWSTNTDVYVFIIPLNNNGFKSLKQNIYKTSFYKYGPQFTYENYKPIPDLLKLNESNFNQLKLEVVKKAEALSLNRNWELEPIENIKVETNLNTGIF